MATIGQVKAKLAHRKKVAAMRRKRYAKLKRQLRHARSLLIRSNKLVRATEAELARMPKSGRARAVKWALAQRGTVESPPFSNSGPKIDTWSRASIGITAISWCQCFANAVLVAGGGAQLKSAYTPAVVEWARRGLHGLKLVPISQAQPGDFLYFKWPGVSRDFCDHVGVVTAIVNGAPVTAEGNTSPGNAGSQNNGGGVYLRTRPRAYMVACVRPTYGKA